MVSKDILKNALLKFDGTLIVVSHDRDFLQGLTDKVFEFRNQKIRVWLGDVFDFLQARKLASLKALEAAKGTVSVSRDEMPSGNKLSYERRKLQEKEIRKAAARVQKVEEEISRLEVEIKRYDLLLANPDSHKEADKSAKLYKEYQQLKTALDLKVEEWESAHVEWEQVSASQ
jgi:ATP-binding cassette subfamily F protein 3